MSPTAMRRAASVRLRRYRRSIFGNESTAIVTEKTGVDAAALALTDCSWLASSLRRLPTLSLLLPVVVTSAAGSCLEVVGSGLASNLGVQQVRGRIAAGQR